MSFSAHNHRYALSLLVNIDQKIFSLATWLCVIWFSPVHFIWLYLQRLRQYIENTNLFIYYITSPLRAALVIIAAIVSFILCAGIGSVIAIIFRKEFFLWWIIDCIILGAIMIPCFALAYEKLCQFNSSFFVFDIMNDAIYILFEFCIFVPSLGIFIGYKEARKFINETSTITVGNRDLMIRYVKKYLELTIKHPQSVAALGVVLLAILVYIVSKILAIFSWAVRASSQSVSEAVVETAVSTSKSSTVFWAVLITLLACTIATIVLLKPEPIMKVSISYVYLPRLVVELGECS
jgi:hypothetical protein